MDHKANALLWLDGLRRGTSDPDFFLESLRGQVSRGNPSLAEIGTSEAELATYGKVSA